MKTFEEFKKEILKRAREAETCADEYKRAYIAKDFAELVKVICDNFNYCCNKKIIDAELIEPMNELLYPLGLCANVATVNNCFILLSGSSTAELYGSSTAELYGSSTAKLYDSSTAELYDSSTAELYGSSTAKLSGSSTAKLYGSSYICSFNTLEHKVNDNAICRYYYEKKIVLTKNVKIEIYENNQNHTKRSYRS